MRVVGAARAIGRRARRGMEKCMLGMILDGSLGVKCEEEDWVEDVKVDGDGLM
jgi:hypothetical protein